MKSLLTAWFLNLKLEVTCEESLRLRPKVLDFRSHGLEKCPNLLEKLPPAYLSNLKCLALQSNLLVDFSRVNCYCLEKLKGLALDYNKLVDLPFDIRHLQNLTSINVSHNNFQSLRFFHIVCQLTNLRILWANATGLTEIPVMEITKLTKLHTLGLRRNRITVLPVELIGLSSLKWLTLDDNHIGEIPSDLNRITSSLINDSLVHLNLRRNYISEIPDSFRLLQELQYLFLDYNLLSIDDNLKSFLRSFPSLKYCSLSGNLPSHRKTGTDLLVQETITHEEYAVRNNNTESENPALSNAFSQASLAQSIRRENNEDLINHVPNEEDETENIVDDENNTTDTDVDTTEDDTENSNDNASGEWGDMKIVYRQSQYANYQENDYVENEYGSTGDDGSLLGEETAFTGQVNTEELLSYLSDDDADDVDDGDQSPQHDLAFDDPTTAYSENDMQVPFESSSTISLLDIEALTTEPTIHPNNSNGERENVDLNSEEWVQDLDKTPGESTSSPTNDEQDEQREQNDELLEDVVNDIIHEATNDTRTATIGVNETPVSRSTSRVYIMPHGRESRPLCLNARSSFSTCNNNFSSSIVTPLEQQGESLGTVTSQTHLRNASSRTTQVHQSQHGSHQNIEISNTEALDFAINQDDLENLVEENEPESDYDPSDWEHSAPSSAIDDQDILSRYADFEDEGVGDEDNLITDFLRIIPLAFVR